MSDINELIVEADNLENEARLILKQATKMREDWLELNGWTVTRDKSLHTEVYSKGDNITCVLDYAIESEMEAQGLEL